MSLRLPSPELGYCSKQPVVIDKPTRRQRHYGHSSASVLRPTGHTLERRRPA